VGIPWQTYRQAVECSDYCRHLLERFHGDRRLCFFNAPLAPFLDPGSLAFESPEEYGYRRLRSTLEEHRQALTAVSWKHVLNYETVNMSRDDIVNATYETALRLAEVKLDFGIMDREAHDQVVAKIEASRGAIDEIDRIAQLPEGAERRERLAALKSTVEEMSVRTLGAKDELKWPITRRFGRTVQVSKLRSAAGEPKPHVSRPSHRLRERVHGECKMTRGREGPVRSLTGSLALGPSREERPPVRPTDTRYQEYAKRRYPTLA